MTPPALLPHVEAAIETLEDADITIGNHRAPDDVEPPYTVVYLIAGGQSGGTLAAPDADAELILQTTSVGSGPDQALWELDRVRAAFAGGVLDVDDRSVQRIRLLTAAGGVMRDEDGPVPLFYAVDRWRIWSFPGLPAHPS